MPAVYGQDPTGRSHENLGYASTMYVETMELGVGATETVVTCGDTDSQCQASTVDLKQLNSLSQEENSDLSQPGTSLHAFSSYDDRYEELNSPASVSSVNSHVAYAEVANENIIKEIENYLCQDPNGIPVKKLRGVIPKMKMVTYLDHEEWQGKEKVKFLWENKPIDWPSSVHHSDPNNGIKKEGTSQKIKPKKEDLIPMFEHLRTKFLQMYRPELLISKPMEEGRAESTVEPKIPPISMTVDVDVPAEDKMAPSGEPATPQPVPETGNLHRMTQMREMVEVQCRQLESQLDKQMIHHLQQVYEAVVKKSETGLCQPDQQSLYIEGCCEVLGLLCKISCGLVSLPDLEQKCKTLIEIYGQKEHMDVKKKKVPTATLR